MSYLRKPSVFASGGKRWAVMKRANKRPKIRIVDRLFWVLLSRIWAPWRKSRVIVKPDTVVHWHRKGVKPFWKFKSKGPGRPQVSHEIRDLVRRMAAANPSWGAPRIHGELLGLGFEVSERTVSTLINNSIMLQNVVDLTKVLAIMAKEGYTITKELVAGLSPFIRNQIRRFGRYEVDMPEHPPDSELMAVPIS